VPCQYFPCSFVLALRELGLRLGVKAQLPLRASSRGVLPGAPNALSVCILDCLSWLTPARASKSRSRGTMHRAGVVLLWSNRDMHSGAARCTTCTLGHVTHFTSRKSCAVGPPHPRISSSSAPCLFSCGKWIRAVSYVCQYSNMSIHMINLAHPAGRLPPGDAT
jgi:hypothetical protein